MREGWHETSFALRTHKYQAPPYKSLVAYGNVAPELCAHLLFGCHRHRELLGQRRKYLPLKKDQAPSNQLFGCLSVTSVKGYRVFSFVHSFKVSLKKCLYEWQVLYIESEKQLFASKHNVVLGSAPMILKIVPLLLCISPLPVSYHFQT